jgi:hypothetical protein
MAPVQEEIVRVLGNSANGMTISELANRVEERQNVSKIEVRAAVLPMISAEAVVLTPDRKLKLPTRER